MYYIVRAAVFSTGITTKNIIIKNQRFAVDRSTGVLLLLFFFVSHTG